MICAPFLSPACSSIFRRAMFHNMPVNSAIVRLIYGEPRAIPERPNPIAGLRTPSRPRRQSSLIAWSHRPKMRHRKGSRILRDTDIPAFRDPDSVFCGVDIRPFDLTDEVRTIDLTDGREPFFAESIDQEFNLARLDHRGNA